MTLFAVSALVVLAWRLHFIPLPTWTTAPLRAARVTFRLYRACGPPCLNAPQLLPGSLLRHMTFLPTQPAPLYRRAAARAAAYFSTAPYTPLLRRHRRRIFTARSIHAARLTPSPPVRLAAAAWFTYLPTLFVRSHLHFWRPTARLHTTARKRCPHRGAYHHCQYRLFRVNTTAILLYNLCRSCRLPLFSPVQRDHRIH